MAFFASFKGWKEISRGKKGKGKGQRSSWVAHFEDAAGGRRQYGLSNLETMRVNPPKSFSVKDHYLLALAIHKHPDNVLEEGKTVFISYGGIQKDEEGNRWCAVFETAAAEEWLPYEAL